MKTTHKLATGLAAAVILAGGALTLPRAFAANSTTTDPLSSLVDKIATKFNLNKTDVQAVFDQNKTDMQAARQAEMQAETKSRLSAAVTAGTLTQAQSDLITTELATIQTKLTDINKITDVNARQAAMDQLQADVSKWAVDNKIDSKWVRIQGERGGRGHGMGGHGMMDNDRDDTTTGSTSSTSPSASATSAN